MQKGTETDEHAQQRLALTFWEIIHAHQATLNRKIHHIYARRSLWAFTAAMLCLAIVWISGNIFGIRYNLRGTVFAARSSDVRLSRLMQDQVQAYRLRLVRPDGKQMTYSLQDMGLQVDVDQSIAHARAEQHAWRNQLQWWRPIPLKLTVRADPKALQRFVTDKATITVSPAHDASLSIVDGSTQLTEGTAGMQYGFTDPTNAILSAASTMQTEPLHMRQTIQKPLVSAKSLAATKRQLDTMLTQNIAVDIDGQQNKPDKAELAGWISYTPGGQNNAVTVTINTDKVREYLEGLAQSHSHPPRAQISLGDSGAIPGSAGVTVGGIDEAVDTIKQKLPESHGLQVTLPTQQKPFKTISAIAADKWFEVDLTNKRMYAYQQTELVKTFLVSAGAPGTPTVVGTFAIYSKYTKQTMSGANADGSHYVQPNVPWVNYFYRDYAIHGNYWRPNSYFGNINSSHGCVGVTPSDGAWVYNWAPVGTPVVVHT